MAMSNKKSGICRYGSRCKKGDGCQYAHPEREANSSPLLRLPKCDNRKPMNSPTNQHKHLTSPFSDRQGNISPRSQSHTRRHQSGARTSSRNRRRNSKVKHSSNQIESIDDDSSHLPLSIEEIKKNIKDLYEEDIPDAREQHELLIAEQESLLDDLYDEETRPIKEDLVKELRDQLEVFNTIILSLLGFNPTTLPEAQNHFKLLKREIRRFQNRLPIYARRLDLIFTISSSPVTIVKADTGSGKSTQLVQYLVDAGLADRGQIVCTQPRRLAARTLASRVAQEFGCKIGEEVDFQVGASNPRLSPQTRIRFVTDAILLNEYHNDRRLSAYSIVIVDEAHERRVDTDLLFGIMKTCLNERHDIKLIVMSATLNVELFSDYYADACLIKSSGRTFPIEDEYVTEDPENYVDAAITKTLEIHASKEIGDILVFLTGPDEINRAIKEMNEKIRPSDSAVVLPLHGKLNEDETQAVFKSTDNGERKIIFATNVAETSITIDGICHVIDSGMVKEVMWDSKRNMRALKIGYTTQSSIKQRRGRAGRTAAGKCYHLYTFDTYESLDICPRAEILCIQPSIAVLKLKYLNVANDVLKFHWLEAPPEQLLRDAVVNLTRLDALDPRTEMLTDVGRSMAKLGLEPMLSAMILAGKKYDCLSHVIALAGMLSVAQNVWWRGKDDQSKQFADEIRASFTHDSGIGGDHILLLRIFLEWNALSENKTWCRERMINGKSMKMAADFVREISYQLDPNFKTKLTELNDDLIERIMRCICAGFFQNLAISNGCLRAGYQLATSSTGTFGQVHRSSTLTYAREPSKFIIYHDILILNEINYLTAVCPIDLDWFDKRWLNSFPRSPSQCVLKDLSITNLGPALLLSIVGKKCRNIPLLQESLGVFIDADYKQSQLTLWGQSEKLRNAKMHFDRIIQREREKLRNEVQEFEIIGTTRILLGAGAQVQSVMVEDEYVKILINSLPLDITEDEIQAKCRSYGTVRNITMLEKKHDGSSALVTYDTCKSARRAVTQLSHEIWNGKEIKVNPSHIRTSIHAGRQNCKLKAYWFMTESECNGRIGFSQPEAAVRANEFFKEKKYHSRIYVNTINPTIKCIWSLARHTGKATIYFKTAQQAQDVLNRGVQPSFRPQLHRKNTSSICIQNVPEHFDEDDLKTLFDNCTNVVLMRGPIGVTFQKPLGVEDDLRRLFNMYPSFQQQSVIVMAPQKTGCLEGYVQFLDEREMMVAIDDMDGKSNLIGAGKLRLSVHKQQQQQPKQKKGDFVVKLDNLPPNVDEEVLSQDLNQIQLSDYIIDVYVARKKLSIISSTNASTNMAEDNEINRTKLQSLFYDKRRFRCLPDIQINSPTNDGRGSALILFNDPRDVTTAMEMYEAPDDPDLLKFGTYKLRLVPLLDHNIELNSALARAIPKKIKQTIDKIKNDPEFSNLRLIQKQAMKNKEEILRIAIRGHNILQIYKARTIFDELMKGQIFKFHSPTWVSVIFDPKGKKFLQELQDQTKTYIWWDWKSTCLRIFGEDQTSNTTYQEIDTYIQKTLTLREYSVSISIPQNCLRQCMQKANEFREFSNAKVNVTIDVRKRLLLISGDQQTVFECEQKVKNFLESFVSVHPTIVALQEQNLCTMCMCKFDSPYSLQQCGHIFCRSCLMNYFESHLNSTTRTTTDALKLCCPFDKCNVACLIRDIVSILGSEKTARLAMIAFEIYIQRSANDLVQCFGDNCNQVYRPSKYASTYFCDQCIKIYCIPCQVEYHIGMTCQQFQQAEKERKSKVLLKTNSGKLPYKRCSKCQTLTEKYAGCNAMKCIQCKMAFCWRCSLTDDEDVHYHYNQKHSSCYNQCFDQTN